MEDSTNQAPEEGPFAHLIRPQKDGGTIIDGDFLLERIFGGLFVISGLCLIPGILFALMGDEDALLMIPIFAPLAVIGWFLSRHTEQYHRLDPVTGWLYFELHFFKLRMRRRVGLMSEAVFLALQPQMSRSRYRGYYWTYRVVLAFQGGKVVPISAYDEDDAFGETLMRAVGDTISVPLREAPQDREWRPVARPVTMTSELNGREASAARWAFFGRGLWLSFKLTAIIVSCIFIFAWFVSD